MNRVNPIRTEQQLRTAMEAEEHEHLEFKAARNDFATSRLLDYCAALCNERGGNFVLGVTDQCPRRIVGTGAFRNLNKIKIHILNELGVRVRVSAMRVSGKRVLAFFCPPRPQGDPVAHDGRYLMRQGESLVTMTNEVLEGIFAEKIPDYSQTMCEGGKFSDLSLRAIAGFRKRWLRNSGNPNVGQMSDKQLLMDAGLVNGSRITRAALILSASPEA